MKRRLPLAAAIIGLALGLAISACSSGPATEAIEQPPAAVDEVGIARLVAAALTAPLPEPQGPAEVVLRSQGQALASWWCSENTWADSVACGIRQGLAELEPSRHQDIDTITICLTHSYRNFDRANLRSRASSNVHRGVRGLELTLGEGVEWVSPLAMIASNRSFSRVIKRFYDRRRAKLRRFESYQLLVTKSRRGWRVQPMQRGNQVVAISAVSQPAVQEMARAMGDWLVRQVRPDGRLTYKYWPSSGRESSNNNMIRQFMATTCLGRLADFRNDDEIRRLRDRNLAYNLKQFFRQPGELGYIEYRGKVKLGAVALAAGAMVESPAPDHGAERSSLLAFVDAMWHPDGRFTTWYKPQQSGGENFYPGEALLLWARQLATAPGEALLARFMKSFEYYRRWHLKHRNPAFIPWHTQAYYLVWQRTGDPELSDFIFTMSDWLVDFQQWEECQHEDTRGRFYDPQRPKLGPPHASSTGVYLEGLIDAFRLARELGDRERAEKYRLAIVRGLRSLMQLQFADDLDMFYISNRDRVRGGLRTTVYNSEIRVDNVQHGLMAMMKILKTFSALDYRHPDNG